MKVSNSGAVDLRSDTVTAPSEGMRQAMAKAEVGDDVYREDPTVRRLEEQVAELTGKPAALFVPTGTMGNQIALLCHTRRGDEVLIGEGAHVAFYESGAGGAIAGVQFVSVGSGGPFTAAEATTLIKPDAYFLPRTRLIALENTHNRAGGRVFPQHDVDALAALAKQRGLAVHLDGARLWNASVATGLSVSALAGPADSVSVCFSKGLGAPVGSALCGSKELIAEALRYRKMLGGAMRQVGVLAAAALYALEHNRSRLHLDHENAQTLMQSLADANGLTAQRPETNIVNIDTPGRDAEAIASACAPEGLLIYASGPERIRAVTHLDVDRDSIQMAAGVLAKVTERFPVRELS